MYGRVGEKNTYFESCSQVMGHTVACKGNVLRYVVSLHEGGLPPRGIEVLLFPQSIKPLLLKRVLVMGTSD